MKQRRETDEFVYMFIEFIKIILIYRMTVYVCF